MSKKPTVTTIASGFYSTSALNNNFTAIRDQFDNTLSLDGSTPNAMGADLDLNSNDILNGGAGNFSSLYLAGSQVVSVGTLFSFEGAWLTSTAYAVNDVVTNSGNTYLCLVAHTSGTFATDLAANKWVVLIDSSSYLLSANDLSDLNSAATARTNLGLGTIATQNANAVALTGGTADGVTIGATTPAAADFTTVDTTGLATLNSMNITGGVAGDVLYHNGTSYVRLAKGAAGQLLEMNSGATAPAWASGGLQFISSTDLSNDATCDFTGWGSLNYDFYELVLQNVIPATDSVDLYLRTTANDSTFDASTSNYVWSGVRTLASGGVTGYGSDASGTAAILLNITTAVGSAAGEEGVSGVVRIYGPHLAKTTSVTAHINYITSGGSNCSVVCAGQRASSAAVTGVRLLFSAGNLESGTVTLYGGRNS